MNRGQITIGIGLAWGGIMAAVSGTTTYFVTQQAVKDKINDTTTEIHADISTDRERISKLEEAISTIKDSQLEERTDIKEILSRVK